jgi:hypothetical protein
MLRIMAQFHDKMAIFVLIRPKSASSTICADGGADQAADQATGRDSQGTETIAAEDGARMLTT